MKNTTFDFVEEFDASLEKSREEKVLNQQNQAFENAQKEQQELINLKAENLGSSPKNVNQEVNSTSEENNTLAFDNLIKQIRDSSNTARDYGTKFETLTKDWLTKVYNLFLLSLYTILSLSRFSGESLPVLQPVDNKHIATAKAVNLSNFIYFLLFIFVFKVIFKITYSFFLIFYFLFT